MGQAPPPAAPFAEKMAYYRTQHTSKGVRAAHLVGTPVIAAGLPLLFAKPKVGAPMFVGGWMVQILGHWLFENNFPSTRKGWITYQLTGVIHVCEQYGEMLARRTQRKAGLR
ncbi:MAG TPA: Mpo1-like protein [Mycobacterium sp.]|nr:Mpo1-like protein [Mycobacterium sp.]HTX97086.1 Mpo1-like protein [Mycobacterium sp.]